MDLRSTTRHPTTTTSVEPGAEGGDAGAGGGGAGAGAAANGADLPFYESFTDEAIKTNPSVQLFKTTEELAKGYVNLEKRFGVDPKLRIELPADPKDEAGMRAVYARLGLPEKVEGYAAAGLVLDDKATEADKAMLGKFTEAAHKLGMPADMAKGAMQFWLDQTKEITDGWVAAREAQAAAGVAALKTEWGQAYDVKVKQVGDSLARYGDPELVKELDAERIGNYPNLVRYIDRMITRMAEPGVAGGQSGDADTGTRPLTPAQAKAAVSTIEANPALRDPQHPQHKAVVQERLRLLAMNEPPSPGA